MFAFCSPLSAASSKGQERERGKEGEQERDLPEAVAASEMGAERGAGGVVLGVGSQLNVNKLQHFTAA